MVEIEDQKFGGLISHARETLRQSGAVGSACERVPAVIGLNGTVDGKSAAQRQIIFEESELARDMPLNAGHSQPKCAAESLMVKVSAFIVDERSGNVLVQAI